MHPHDGQVQRGGVGGHHEDGGAGGHHDGGKGQVHGARQHVRQKEVEETVARNGLEKMGSFKLEFLFPLYHGHKTRVLSFNVLFFYS